MQISPERAAAGEAKAALAAVLEVYAQQRTGVEAGAGWRTTSRVLPPARIPADAWQRLRGPRALWPQIGEFGGRAWPDGPGRRVIQLSALAVRGYPDLRLSGWLTLDQAPGRWVRQAEIRSAGRLRLAVLRRGRVLQMAGAVQSISVALQARERAFLQPGRWTQEPIAAARCTDLGRAPWADLRLTLEQMTGVAPEVYAAGLTPAARRHALTLPLLTGRRPFAAVAPPRIQIRTTGRAIAWRAQVAQLWVGITQSGRGARTTPEPCPGQR